MAGTVIGITAQPASASWPPSCRAYAVTPGWYDTTQNKLLSGEGETVCTAVMAAVNVYVELDVYKAGNWAKFGTTKEPAGNTLTNVTSVWDESIGACKYTGASGYATKANGTAIYFVGGSGAAPQSYQDPQAGGYRWSAATTLDCGNPPPPPDPCGTVGAQSAPSAEPASVTSSRRATTTPRATPSGGIIPTC